MFENVSDLVDVHYAIEKLRVSRELRLLSLGKNNSDVQVTKTNKKEILTKGKTKDPTSGVVYDKLIELEDYIEDHITSRIKNHPVWTNWASKVRGVSPMLLAKVMGRCDIEKFTTLGKARAHAGLAPNQKRVRGQKLDYDAELKMALWIIVRQLIFAGGVYYDKYKKQKEYYTKREESKGVRVIPTPQGKMEKIEQPGVMYLGHIDNMAKRWLARLFMDHLVYVWRQAEGLELREPWCFEYGHHKTFIPPLKDD